MVLYSSNGRMQIVQVPVFSQIRLIRLISQKNFGTPKMGIIVNAMRVTMDPVGQFSQITKASSSTKARIYLHQPKSALCFERHQTQIHCVTMFQLGIH